MRRPAATVAAALAWVAVAVAAVPAAAAAESPPTLGVTAAALYAPATHQFLLSDHLDVERPIASTTKLMTALVVLQHVRDLNRTFVYPDYHQAPSDSQIGLRPGDRMTVRDLLVAMLLPSADDAAQDLAYNVGHGSVARFVAMMNAQARALGLRHTHYSTPIGLDTPGNYSTAHDLVKLAQYDLTHSRFFARTVALHGAALSTGPVRYVSNLNTLVSTVPWIDGVKTGHTDNAGYVLVASGRKHGLTLISAVLGTDSETARNANTLALLRYGYGNFRTWTPIRAGEVVARPLVEHRAGVHVPVHATRSFARVLADDSHVHLRVSVPHRLAGPLPKGTLVGHVAVVDDGRVLTSVGVVLQRTLPAVSGLTVASHNVTRPLTLVLIALAVAAGALALIVVRRRAGARSRRRSTDGDHAGAESGSGMEAA